VDSRGLCPGVVYSPGGMPDGSVIQERDPLTVPSTRRNPVIADVFGRLGLMERKGSGFGKIIHAYEHQINFTDDKRPEFRSDRYQFTVIMPNLNYSVAQNVAQNVAQDVAQNNYLSELIIAEIRNNNKITRAEIAQKANVSVKTVERELKQMSDIKYIGSGYSGHWEIEE